MLKTLLAAGVLCVSTSLAYSDTVNFAFQGTAVIKTSTNGLTCELVGSGAGSVPTGCNYSIGFDVENGVWSVNLTAGNNVCTQSIKSSDPGAQDVCKFE